MTVREEINELRASLDRMKMIVEGAVARIVKIEPLLDKAYERMVELRYWMDLGAFENRKDYESFKAMCETLRLALPHVAKPRPKRRKRRRR